MLYAISWVVLLIYFITSILYWQQFISGNKITLNKTRYWLTASVGIHFLFILCFILEISRIPIATVSESLQTFVWITAILYLFLESSLKERSLGALVLSLIVVLLMISNFTFIISETINPILYDVKFETHVFAMLFANSAFMLSFIASVLHLLLSREIKKKEPGIFFRRLPSLLHFERISDYAISIGLIFLSFGLVLGFYSATQVWTGIMTDPKIISVLITLLIYFIYFVGRKMGTIRGQRAALISLIGFISILISFLVISKIIPTSHHFG